MLTRQYTAQRPLWPTRGDLADDLVDRIERALAAARAANLSAVRLEVSRSEYE